MIRKPRKTAHFCTLVQTVGDKHGIETEEVLDKQADIEDEVHNYYEMLYKLRDIEHTEEEKSERIGQEIKKHIRAQKNDSRRSNRNGQLNDALKNTRNNISPGVSGLSGAFYKVFWKWLPHIVLKAIHMIYEDKQKFPFHRG